MNPAPVVLVTGCSSGIGAATARRLHRAGMTVYGTGRRMDALADLAAEGIATLRLDVTDEESAHTAVEKIHAEHGAVDILVNNAGYGVIDALEEAPLDAVRAQFETNFFGSLRLAQLVLPGMRERRRGRIINVSSVFGRLSVPGNAIYAASKHAVEALSDGLRLEVAAFGVRVVLVEPGPMRTRFAANIVARTGDGSGPYDPFRARLGDWYDEVFGQERRTLPARFAGTADDVAAVIARAARSRRPKARYPVGTLARGLLAMERGLPDPLLDRFVRAQFPVP